MVEVGSYINIDKTSEHKCCRNISILAKLDLMYSRLGFRYSSFKAITKYMRVDDIDVFTNILLLDTAVATNTFRLYNAAGGKTVFPKHATCILMFLVWERVKLNGNFRRDFSEYTHLSRGLVSVCHNQSIRTNAPDKNHVLSHNSFYPRILTEVKRAMALGVPPRFARFKNKRYPDLDWWVGVPTIRNLSTREMDTIIAEINRV